MASGTPFNFLDFIGLFLLLSGFIIGLGAVTVIDIHGWLGRYSSYWTEATIRTHKVTKQLIWSGVFLAVLGGIIFYRHVGFAGIPLTQALIAVALVANGYFLSFKVSPFLLQREREGRAREILPDEWQKKIMASMIVSDIGWWAELVLSVIYLLRH